MNTHPMAEGGLLGGLTSLAGLSLILMPALFVVGQAAADIVLAVIGVLFLLHSLIARDWRWLAEPWIVVALAVWIYLMLNAAYVAADPVAANTRAQPFGRFIIFAAALQFWLFVRPLVRRWFLVVLALVLGFVLVDCLIQFWLGRDLFGRPYERLRLTGPFAERVPGDFLSRLSLPVLAMAFAATRATCRWHTVALVAGTGLLVLTIALTGERAALIMFAFGLGLLFLFLGGARRPLLITGLGSALLVGGAITLDPAVSKRLIEHTTHDLTNFWERRIGELWLRGVDVWEDAPLFGIGLKNFRLHCARNDFLPRGRVEDRCYTHPHQLWNEWLAETGIVGLAGFVALIGLWSRRLLWKLRRRDQE
jgi:O-antigen ligase